MGDSRTSRGEGARRSIARGFKLRVHAALERNKKSGDGPSSVGALADVVGADRGGLGRTLDPDGAQMTSTYADSICEALNIELRDPASPADDEAIRSVPEAQQAALLALISGLYRETADLPEAKKIALHELLAQFMRDYTS